MVYRVNVIWINPYSEFEEFAIFDFYSDLDAWKFFEFMMKSTNVHSVSKPFNPFQS